MNLQSSLTYDNFGRRTSRTLQQDNNNIASAGRSYDTFSRIASVSNGTDTLSYTYRPGGQLSLAGWTNGQNAAMSNQSYEYDQYNRLISIKLNNVNEVSYTLNAKDQRTAATYANAGLWNFTYDDKGQVTGANGSSKSYAYSYDGIGNRLTANENSTVTNYTSNLLNQYTLINSAVPNYDADGNMTSSGNGWAYTYNGENRITQATKGSTTVTMAYDYAGRRISKTVSESGVVQNSYKYVYDGFKLIAVYNNNDLVMTFTWQPESLGMDVPVSMTYSGTTYYYVTDGNKNVTALLDASGNRVAEYVYGPFGQTVSATGSMAQINPFRFSSEFHDDETRLVYYNYRYYSPELGRWTKRDPIEEEGGSNLYGTNNNLINYLDRNGLVIILIHGVNTNAAWFSLAEKGFKQAGIKQAVIRFTWFDNNAWGGLKRKQGGQPNYATDSVAGMNSSSMDRSYMLSAVNRLNRLLNNFNSSKKRLHSCESITIIAHSQGSIITIAALQKGAKIDNLIIMGSPLDIWPYDKNNNDLIKIQNNVAKMFNYWSNEDEWAFQKGGVGYYGDKLARHTEMKWITNREFAPGNKINGFILPSEHEFSTYDHSDYMAKSEFFEKIYSVDVAPTQDLKISHDEKSINLLRRIADGK